MPAGSLITPPVPPVPGVRADAPEATRQPVVPASCPLCGDGLATRVSPHLRAPMAEMFTGRPHRCNTCDLIFLHPMMTEAEQQEFYNEKFRRLYHGDGYDLDTFHQRARLEARRRFEMLDEVGLLQGAVLELGSSSGAFLETLVPAIRSDAPSGRVELAIGVEPDQRQRQFASARGWHTVADLSDAPGRPFDLIVAFHVLEHLRDPVGMLRDLGARLRPGGALVVEVPNVDDVLLSRYDIPEFDRFYWHPAHCLYFSHHTLAQAGRAAGLTVTVEPLQRYSLSNHLHWALHRRPGGQKALADLISMPTERAYAADLCRQFLCDTLWMVARCPS